MMMIKLTAFWRRLEEDIEGGRVRESIYSIETRVHNCIVMEGIRGVWRFDLICMCMVLFVACVTYY